MKTTVQIRNAQNGGFLLEALIGILIFSFGILGIVGLQAQAIRFTNESEYRAEAMYLANSLISQMWTEDRSQLKNNYDSTIGTGGPYIAFKNKVNTALHGAAIVNPIVKVDTADLPPAPSTTSSVVQVSVFWQMPGEFAGDGITPVTHNYTTTGVVGQN
jgi:type IV pilus assembly protein PilV